MTYKRTNGRIQMRTKEGKFRKTTLRDQLKSRVAELEDALRHNKEAHAVYETLGDQIEKLEKQLAESRAEAAGYRRALEEIKDQTEIERNPDFYQNERALPYAAALGLIFQRTKEALSPNPSEFLEAVEQAREALAACDIALKAAKPCVNGGEHMNDKIAEEALTRLNKVLGERGQK